MLSFRGRGATPEETSAGKFVAIGGVMLVTGKQLSLHGHPKSIYLFLKREIIIKFEWSGFRRRRYTRVVLPQCTTDGFRRNPGRRNGRFRLTRSGARRCPQLTCIASRPA